MQQGHVILDSVEITILDEADHMADLGFLPGVRRIMDKTPARAADALLGHARRRDQRPRQALPHQSQDARGRFGAVARLDDGAPRAPRRQRLAPARAVRPHGGARTHRRLHAHQAPGQEARQAAQRIGVPAVELHGNLSQGARTRNMDDFHSGRAQTLVATDIAARGIHVDDVALVIHADPPVEHKAYLHRSGRTARAGNDGTVVTMMLDEQVRDVRDLTRKAGIKPTTTRVQLGHPLLTELAPGERSYGGGLVREEAPRVVAPAAARVVARAPAPVARRVRLVAVAAPAAVAARAPSGVPARPRPASVVAAPSAATARAALGPASWRLRHAAPVRRWHRDGPDQEHGRRQRRVLLGRQPRRLASLSADAPARSSSSGHFPPMTPSRVRTFHRDSGRVGSFHRCGPVKSAHSTGVWGVGCGARSGRRAAASAELRDDLAVGLPGHRHVGDATAPYAVRTCPSASSTSPSRLGAVNEMSAPAATVRRPCELQASAKHESASGEDVAAVADAVTVDHVVANRQAHHSVVGLDDDGLHAEGPRRHVVSPHLPREGHTVPAITRSR